MVVEHDTTGKKPPKPDGVLATAGAGLKRICAEAEVRRPVPRPPRPACCRPPRPAGFMAPIDLPVLPRVDKPWVSTSGTTPKGTGCEKIDLKKAKAEDVQVADVRRTGGQGADRVRAGHDGRLLRHPGGRGHLRDRDPQERRRLQEDDLERDRAVRPAPSTPAASRARAWEASYDTGGGKNFTYRIGIAVSGARAVYVLYPVLEDLDITDTAFNDVLTRAAERSAAYK